MTQLSNQQIEAIWKTDPEEFEYKANEIFERFLDGLPKKEIPKGDDDYWLMEQEGWAFMYPQSSYTLARRMRARLHKLAERYFPDIDIDISSHLFREI